MPAHFVVALDTQGPQAVFGSPSSTEAGTQLVLPFVLDEIAVPPLFANFRDSQGHLHIGLAENGQVRINLPADIWNGPGQVELAISDDVGNWATHALSVEIHGGADYLDPLAAQVAGGPKIHAAGPVDSEEPSYSTERLKEILRDDLEVFLAMGEDDLYLVALDDLERLERAAI